MAQGDRCKMFASPSETYEATEMAVGSKLLCQGPLLDAKRRRTEEQSVLAMRKKQLKQRWKHLSRALARLQSALEAIPKGVRRVAIEGFSEALRHELISFIEAQRLRKQPFQGGSSNNVFGMKRDKAAAASKVKQTLGKRLMSGGSLLTVKTRLTQYHRARCQISGILIRSGSMRCPTKACALQRRLRAAVLESSPREQLEKRLTSVLQTMATFSSNCSGSMPPPTFAVVLDARRWIGRSLESPALASLAEALALRRKANQAEARGWPSVRALWLDWLQVHRPARFRHRVLTASEADALVAAADIVASRVSVLAAARESRASELAARKAASLAKKLRSAARHAEVLLAKVMPPLLGQTDGLTRRNGRIGFQPGPSAGASSAMGRKQAAASPGSAAFHVAAATPVATDPASHLPEAAVSISWDGGRSPSNGELQVEVR